MSANDIDFAVQDYTSNVELLLQRMGGKFLPFVSSAAYVGKAAQVVDQVGVIEAQLVSGKYTPIGRTDVPVDQRWVYPKDYHIPPQMIDTFDELRLKITLQGPFTQSATNALGRAQDNEIIDAFFADAKTGVDGGTTTSFGTTTTATGRNIAVATGAAAATGMNVTKLRKAVQRLKSFHVDVSMEVPTCAITSIQEDNLLGDVQITSGDFNWGETPVLRDGKLTHFLGVNFIQNEGLDTGTDDAASTSRMCPMWVKSGMHFGQWNGISHFIDYRQDLVSRPWQVYSKATFGATRTQENKVIRIWAYEG